ncbi:hypothetical protein OF83DRAFT_1177809 [Amylostereum chailletii]|nr:hypothetical protein OF83DRAFT_1177809 [Amylostereum chailletii]
MSQPMDARAPFDDLTANAILRSTDNVDFRIQTVILTIASPIFKDIVTESSHILDLFLRILYPVDSPKITKLADVRVLLEVSRKYEIEAFKAPVSFVLEDALEDDPVGVFALSLAYGLNNIVAHAAHYCILLPISKLDCPELEQISIHQYRRLLQFHFDASQEISAVLAKTNWFREVEGQSSLSLSLGS